jgi:hypothetical protein
LGIILNEQKNLTDLAVTQIVFEKYKFLKVVRHLKENLLSEIGERVDMAISDLFTDNLELNYRAIKYFNSNLWGDQTVRILNHANK